MILILNIDFIDTVFTVLNRHGDFLNLSLMFSMIYLPLHRKLGRRRWFLEAKERERERAAKDDDDRDGKQKGR